MLLAGPSRYDEWDDSIIEDLHNKAQKKNKSDKPDKIDNYIAEVNKQNEKYKDINNLKNILDIEYDSMKKIETVEDEKKPLYKKAKALEKQNKEQKRK